MAVLSCSTTHSSIRSALHSSVVTITSASCNCLNINFIQMNSHSILSKKTCRIYAVGGNSHPKVCAIDPHRTSSTTHLGNWEDPDGSDSETDEEEEETEENNLDFESDWEEERDTSDAPVEELLTPEERAILQQNETPNLDKISTEKWNPLHTLALAGQIKFMDSLLGNGFDIDAVDKDGQTALHKAVLGKKEAVISHLLRKGASPHVRDLVDVNVADNVNINSFSRQFFFINLVFPSVKYSSLQEGWTPLHVAMQSRSRDIAKVLLVNGADKTRRTE
ncbi:Ankyrin repeat-containing protein, partial [Cynara cardunculus var. scolymus]